MKSTEKRTQLHRSWKLQKGATGGHERLWSCSEGDAKIAAELFSALLAFSRRRPKITATLNFAQTAWPDQIHRKDAL
jgi:hypothetical protein